MQYKTEFLGIVRSTTERKQSVFLPEMASPKRSRKMSRWEKFCDFAFEFTVATFTSSPLWVSSIVVGLVKYDFVSLWVTVPCNILCILCVRWLLNKLDAKFGGCDSYEQDPHWVNQIERQYERQMRGQRPRGSFWWTEI